MKFEPWVAAYNLLNKKLGRVYPKFQTVHVRLKKGGVLIAYKAYIAYMVLMSIITFSVVMPLSFFLFPFLLGASLFSLSNLFFSLLFGVTGAFTTLLVMYLYPAVKASNRKKPIDNNLPYIANFLTLLSSSNVPPSVIFKSMSRIDTLKEVRHEFGSIVRDVELFGTDLMTSIVENSKYTPSSELHEMMVGYVATVRTGGNPTDYLKITSDNITKKKVAKLDMMLESLSAVAEIYIMLLVATPLLFTVLFATLGMIGGGGTNMGLLLYLLTYLGIPIMGAVLIIIMSTFEK